MAIVFVSLWTRFVTITRCAPEIKSVQSSSKGLITWNSDGIFEIFVHSLGEGASEPNVRLTMAYQLGGPFFCQGCRLSINRWIRLPNPL